MLHNILPLDLSGYYLVFFIIFPSYTWASMSFKGVGSQFSLYRVSIGRAKIFDMTAIGSTGRTIKIQVKSTYHGYDCLVTNKFDPSANSIVALVCLGKNATQKLVLFSRSH